MTQEESPIIITPTRGAEASGPRNDSFAASDLLHSQGIFNPIIRQLSFTREKMYLITFKPFRHKNKINTTYSYCYYDSFGDEFIYPWYKTKMLDSVKKTLGPCTFGFYVQETEATTYHVHVLIATDRDMLKLHGKPACNKRGFFDVREVANNDPNKLKVFNYLIKESYKKDWKKYRDYNHTKIRDIFL